MIDLEQQAASLWDAALNGTSGLVLPTATEKKEKSVTPIPKWRGAEDDGEFDPLSLLDRMYDENNRIVRDIVIDDGDMKEAPNFWAFSTEKAWLGVNLYTRQLWPISCLFGEICFHCTHPKYRDILDVPLDGKAEDFPEYVQLLHFGKCLKCGRTKLDLLRERRIMPYQELGALAGQRVGKSLITSASTLYLTHKMLKLQNINEAYGGLINTLVVGTFVGLTFDAATEQLWIPFKNFMEASPFFQEYHKMLRYHAERTGRADLIKQNQTSLYYGHRQMLIYPSGPNKKTLRGKTRFFGACDELDWFSNDAQAGDSDRMNGNEVYASLNNSLRTLRAGWSSQMKKGFINLPNAFQFNISSPSSMQGVLTDIVMRNKVGSKYVYVFHAATWEINPRITKKMLAQEYDNDPVKADRDFGAIPFSTSNAFLRDEATAIKCLGRAKNAVRYRYVHRKLSDGTMRRAAVIEGTTPPHTNGGIPPCVLALDAGVADNSFALIVGYRYVLPDGKKRLIFPAVVEVMPEKGVATLDFSAIYEKVISRLIKDFNVKVLLADRWNSIKLLHDAESDFGLVSKQYSLKYNDFFLVRSYMESGSIVVPAPETPVADITSVLTFESPAYPKIFENRPIDHFFMECMTVRDTGKTIDKGSKLTDDTWRAFALAAHHLLDEKFCEKYLKETKKVAGFLGASSRMVVNTGYIQPSRVGAVGGSMLASGNFSRADMVGKMLGHTT